MGPAVWIWNRIRERQNLVVIAVVVLQDDIDKNLVALPRNQYRFGMNHLFVFAKLLYKFFDAVLVDKCFLFWRVASFVRQRDFQPGIEKRQFAQPGRESFKFELGRDRENRWIGRKSNQRPGSAFVFDFADYFQLLRRLTPRKGHVINLATARHFHFEPI